MSIDKVNFTSKIRFVDAKTFDKVKRGNFIPWNPFSEYIQKGDEFYTESVRTCTAGALIDSKKRKAVAFHIYDCIENYKKLPELISKIFGAVANPDKCFLFGGKYLGNAPYSIDIFETINKQFVKKIDNATFFKQHMYPWSETDLCYSLNDDTWYIRSMYRDNKDFKERDISSKEELEKCFKKIKIASDDILIFG